MTNMRLTNTITYWLVGNNDGGGGIGWSAPVVIPARIAFVAEQVFSAEGKNTFSSNAIYAETQIPVGAFIAQGSFSDLEPVSSAEMVLKVSHNPTMSTLARMLI